VLINVFVLDTSAILEIIHGTDAGKRVVSVITENAAFTTPFSVYEVLMGERHYETPKIKEFFSSAKTISFGDEAAAKAVEIAIALTKSGNLVNKIDIFIAAICMMNDGTLITRDRDFRRIHGLKCEVI